MSDTSLFYVNLCKVATYWRSAATTSTLPQTAPQTLLKITNVCVECPAIVEQTTLGCMKGGSNL